MSSEFSFVKMPCLCAPTSHAGSFRCRLHRSNSWSGRSIPRPRISGSDLEVSTASLIENSLRQDSQMTPPVPVAHPVGSYPPPRSSPPRGSSRLRNVVSSSDEEDEAITPPSVPPTERMANMKMASGTGGSFTSAPGGRAAMFRMLRTGQSPSKIYS